MLFLDNVALQSLLTLTRYDTADTHVKAGLCPHVSLWWLKRALTVCSRLSLETVFWDRSPVSLENLLFRLLQICCCWMTPVTSALTKFNGACACRIIGPFCKYIFGTLWKAAFTLISIFEALIVTDIFIAWIWQCRVIYYQKSPLRFSFNGHMVDKC